MKLQRLTFNLPLLLTALILGTHLSVVVVVVALEEEEQQQQQHG